MISQRVANDEGEAHGQYIIMRRGKYWRVYDDGSYYSQVSGGVQKLGKAQRDADGCIVNFLDKEHAEQWIDGGLIVVPHVKNAVNRY